MKIIPVLFKHNYSPKSPEAFLENFISFAHKVAKSNDLEVPTLEPQWHLYSKARLMANAIGINTPESCVHTVYNDADMAKALLDCMSRQDILEERVIDHYVCVLKDTESKSLPIQVYKVLYTINFLGHECVIDAGGSFEIGSTQHTVFFDSAEIYDDFVDYIKKFITLYENELPYNEVDFVIKTPDYINWFYTYRQDFVFAFLNNKGQPYKRFGELCKEMAVSLGLPPRKFEETYGSDAQCADIIVAEYLAYLIRCEGVATKAKGFKGWIEDNESRLRNGNMNIAFVVSSAHGNKLNKGAKELFKSLNKTK